MTQRGWLGGVLLLGLVARGTSAQPTTTAGNVVQGSCNAVGSGNRITCNDLAQIRKALEPELRSQLDRVWPSLDAQRQLFESLILRWSAKSSREHAALSNQLSEMKAGMRDEMKAAVAEALADRRLSITLKDWIERAQRLEAELTGPDNAHALALLRAGDLEGAEQALAALQAQQTESIEQLEAVVAAARHAEDVAQQALVQQRTTAAETRVARGDVRALRFDFAGAAEHFRSAIRTYRGLRQQGYDSDELNSKRAEALLAVGAAYSELSRWNESLRAHRVAVAIYERMNARRVGAFDSKLAVSLNNLALLLKATNRLAEAEPLMRRALNIFQCSFGVEHPQSKVASHNLEQLLAELAKSRASPAGRER